MTTSSNMRLVLSLYDAYLNGDRAAAEGLLAPNIAWHMPPVGAPNPGVLEGREAVLDSMFSGLQPPREDFQVVDVLVGDHRVAALLRPRLQRGEAELVQDLIQLFVVDDGRIVEARDFVYDQGAITEFLATYP